MQVTIFSGRANPGLAESIASELKLGLGRCTVENFPDDEIRIEIEEDFREHDVYLVQSTSPPVAEHLLELLLLADACRRAGAGRITGVVPYFGYARQDRRAKGAEPVGARLAADLLAARLDRIIAVDLHNPAIEGFFSLPLEHLSAVPLLVETLRPTLSGREVVVAPDLGAVKLAQRYADLLELPIAYVHKERFEGKTVGVRGIVGEVADRVPLLVDDMISTGGTMVSAIRALLDRNCRPRVTVVATHGLLVGEASANLAGLPVDKVLVTDSVSHGREPSLPIRIAGLGPLLADAVGRMSGIFP
ncbi:MAG: ribose-phosphate pyrophosphokinase [Desulfuromonadales bacterium]|jgi:ribose-phosphate pyrophosphokinase